MTVTQVHSLAYPQAPAAPPLKGSLLDLLDIQLEGKAAWFDGQGMFVSYNCLDTGIVLGNTCGATAGSKFSAAANPIWQDGLKFASFGVVKCKLEDASALEAGVQGAFLAAESRGLEEAFIRELVVANPVGSGKPGAWAAATDITPTPGTAVSMAAGIGLLESHMGQNYAGEGIIHLPRIVASQVGTTGGLEWDGDKLFTDLKTPVAAGAGYDLPNTGPAGTAPAAATDRWIYATGKMLLIRQRIPTVSTLHRDAAITGVDPNDVVALSEAVYILAVDCYKAAVLVKAY
jgi:hypothetical protein